MTVLWLFIIIFSICFAECVCLCLSIVSFGDDLIHVISTDCDHEYACGSTHEMLITVENQSSSSSSKWEKKAVESTILYRSMYIYFFPTHILYSPAGFITSMLGSARFGSSWLVISTRSLALCLKFFKYLYRHFSLCLAPLFSALFLSFNINCNIYTLKRNWLLLHTTWLAFFWFHHRHQHQQERGREGEMEIQETNCKYFMKLKWNFDLFLFFHMHTVSRDVTFKISFPIDAMHSNIRQ